jgi:hypothetical protein
MAFPRALPFLLLPVLACGPTVPEDAACARFSFPQSPQPGSTVHLACSSTACGDGLSPPTSGPHCSNTAPCRVHEAALNPCVWLHNLEHGHAVFLYNCPEGCPDVIATLDALRQEVPLGTNGVARALIAPSPHLPSRVAALLWRRSWLSDSADPEALRCFLKLQDEDAPEPGLSCLP